MTGRMGRTVRTGRMGRTVRRGRKCRTDRTNMTSMKRREEKIRYFTYIKETQ